MHNVSLRFGFEGEEPSLVLGLSATDTSFKIEDREVRRGDCLCSK